MNNLTVFTQRKMGSQLLLLHEICHNKIFGVFTDPIFPHIATHQRMVFAIAITFLILLLLFNGHKV